MDNRAELKIKKKKNQKQPPKIPETTKFRIVQKKSKEKAEGVCEVLYYTVESQLKLMEGAWVRFKYQCLR